MAGGVTDYGSFGCHVAQNYGTGPDDGILTYGYSWYYNRSRSDERPTSNGDVARKYRSGGHMGEGTNRTFMFHGRVAVHDSPLSDHREGIDYTARCAEGGLSDGCGGGNGGRGMYGAARRCKTLR